jgi:hypothetical protein
MYKSFVYPSGSSAMNAIRKSFKAVAPNVEVLYWVFVCDKRRLAVHSQDVDVDIALDIYKETKKKSREITIKFKLPQWCMIPLNFKAIAEKLEEQSIAKKMALLQ